MPITVVGDDIRDVSRQIEKHTSSWHIRIKFDPDASDFGRKPSRGCVVDATRLGTSIADGSVPKQFATPQAALAYLARVLKAQDAAVKRKLLEYSKQERKVTQQRKSKT